MPRPLRVFLCHASQDKPAVRELYTALKSEGWIDPWLDKAKLLPGQDWELVIEKAVDASDVVIICLSTHSISKEGFVQKEIRYAYDIALEKPEETIFLIPLRLDDCNVPRKLKTFHWVNYFDAEKKDAYSDLLESLKLRYDQKTVAEAEELERAQSEKERSERERSERLAREQAENERKAKEERDRIAAQKAENERLAREKAENERKERETINRLAAQKAEAERKPIQNSEFKIQNLLLIGGALLILLCLVFGSYLINNPASPSPTETTFVTDTPPVNVPAAMEAPTTLPPATEAPALSVGSTPSPTETALITDTPPVNVSAETEAPVISEKDGMTTRYVPAGEFTMGSENGVDDEKPVHQVYLDAFWMDQTEVTNAMYKLCVAAGKCNPPDNQDYNNSTYAEHPVVYVDYYQATGYCEWAGRRLPTEAEWEKAARGTDGRTYPWGNAAPTKNLLNYNGNIGDTTKVGSYPNSKSPYGLYDMAGNVWEWVNDRYGADYYVSSPAANPPGPDSGSSFVLRGGSWDFNVGVSVRAANRYFGTPFIIDNEVGFRCARSAK